VALQVEGVVNRSVHAEEALGRSRRLEALQLALASSHCLMRVFRPIVIPQPLLMRTSKPETPERRGVGAQLVGDQQFRCETLLLEQLAHQPQRRPGVAPALDQHVEELALVVDGATDTSARRRSAPPSRPGASDCSAADGTGVAVARSPVRISAPSAAPFRKRYPARSLGDLEERARPYDPPMRGTRERTAKLRSIASCS
jgi:hypothetical protein